MRSRGRLPVGLGSSNKSPVPVSFLFSPSAEDVPLNHCENSDMIIVREANASTVVGTEDLDVRRGGRKGARGQVDTAMRGENFAQRHLFLFRFPGITELRKRLIKSSTVNPSPSPSG